MSFPLFFISGDMAFLSGGNPHKALQYLIKVFLTGKISAEKADN